MSGGGNIKVVVRCRPLNSRELARGATGLIRMDGNQTIISKPPDQRTGKESEDIKAFTFDKSYWSADKNDPSYADQQTVYDDLGEDLLNHAFDGYNCCIFAYGQTGSGKSYSMMGYGEDKGVIPRTCSELFNRINRIAETKDEKLTHRVEVSYIEIYNEKVRDLLNPKNKGNLKVREHPSTGPYVEDLSRLVVTSFDDINHLMDEGNKARTVAATNMNETSSRSHAVFTLFLTQKRIDDLTNLETEKVARISLVDLAGSERANSTGATGTRLKEGANINRSLTTLGKVIAGLAEQSLAEGKKGRKSKEVFVPYRDSILTWLLKDSLGGNSKTAMIAAISPADYDETLSTLRYADQAKKIKNKAVVNEDPNAKMIRELKDELEVLRDRLRTYAPEEVEQLTASSAYKKSGGPTSPLATRFPANPLQSKTNQEFEITDSQGKKKKMTKQEIIDQLQSSEKLLANLHETWEEKLKKTEEIQVEREKALAELGIAVHKNNVGVYAPKRMPHLVNLNEDPLMSECLMYQLKLGVTLVGRSESQVQADIRLSGSNIQEEHCSFENNNGTVTLHPGNDSLTMVNGRRLESPQRLKSGYRIILGDYHIFRFNHPEEVRRERDLQKLVVEKGMSKDGSNTTILDDDADRPESPTENSSMMGSEIMDWNYARREAVLNYYSTESNFGGLKDEELEKIYDDITRVRKSRRTRSESRTDNDDDDSSRGSVRNSSTPTMIEDGTESVSTELTFAHSELEEKFKVEKERMLRELDDQKRHFEAKINRMSRQFSQQTMTAATTMNNNNLSSADSTTYTPAQQRLVTKVANHWKRLRNVAMAEMVLTNAMVLKEANIISRELRKDVVYQFTVIDDGPFSNPMSSWEPTSALHQFETDEDTSFIPSTKPCVGVRVIDRKNQVIYTWSLEKLKLRLQKMRNLYNFIDRPLYSKHFNWEDPFFENPCPKYTFIGGATVCLRNLILQQSYQSQVPVMDRSTGQIKGLLRVLIAPIARSVAIKGPEARFLPFSDTESEYTLDINNGDKINNNNNNSNNNNNNNNNDNNNDIDDDGNNNNNDISTTQQVQTDQQLLFEIRLCDLSGLSEAEYTQVHVQYKLSSFGGIPPDSISEKIYTTSPAEGFGNGDPIQLNHSQTISLVVTNSVLEVLSNGTLAFEVYGLAQPKALSQFERWDDQREKDRLAKTHPGYHDQTNNNNNNDNAESNRTNEPPSPIPSSLAVTERRPEEELLMAERHDVVAWIQISELLPNGDYQPVETISEHALDRGVFTLRQGLQRRIHITLYHTSGRQFEWQRISKATIGRVRQLTSKGRMIDSTSYEAIPIKLLGHPTPSGVTYNSDGTSQLSIQGAWDSSQHDCLFLNQLTPSRTRIILHLAWEVEASKCAKPISFGMDIAVRVTGRDRSSSYATSRFKKLLLGAGSGKYHKQMSKASGVFLVLLKPPMTRRVDQLWRLNTASKYIRGEELFLGSWRPRGVSLINDYKIIRRNIQMKEDLQKTNQVLTLQHPHHHHPTSSTIVATNSAKSMDLISSPIPLSSLPPSPPPSSTTTFIKTTSEMTEDQKLALLRKVIDLWKMKFGSRQDIQLCQDPPIPGNQETAHQQQYQQLQKPLDRLETNTNLLADVKLISQSPNITKKGYLVYQEDALEDIWIKRWFVMRRPYITIYIDDSEKDETGIINVTSVRVDYNRDLEKLIQRTNVFALYTSNNAYTIQTSTKSDMMDWISKIDQKFPMDRLLDDSDYSTC
ncbi:uncharacterized protein BX664DRAFT_197879 [Halteromyces radiatus]|uniref:uncharacterized protein n=1 Tax=Halteromyces radiatus TaxID=101107 RepID=UPI00221EEDD4|nr:uncharacterized protein BX664DRAFT_197879 [Halteromyces radiatus]KAI8081649.1 hypothetical protein BX664DRAFT_197879 [Halteromyces radiatus]